MNNKMQWERTNDKIIDVSDLFLRLVGQLKWMILCGIIVAALFGGYKYNQSIHQDTEDYIKKAEKVKLTSVEQQAVQNAENAMNNILKIQDYMDKSIYININPNQVNTVTMFYGVSNTGKINRRQIIEGYLSYINNGGVAKYIQEKNPEYKDLGTAYLSELISATKYASEEQERTLILEKTDTSSWFYIKVLAGDMEQAKKFANQVQDALEEYSFNVNKELTNHHLELIDRQEAEICDKNLANSWNDYSTRLTDNKYRVDSLISSFSEEQNIVYNAYLQKNDLIVEIQDDITGIQILLYSIVGLLAGIVLYSCVYFVFYLYSGTVKSVRELQQKYTFRVFGVLCLKGKKAIKNGSKEQDKLTQKIELLCVDGDIKEIGILPTFSLEEVAEKKVQELQERLEKKGIHSKLVVDICENPEQWAELRHIGHAIPVFDMGHTTYQEINEELNFCQDNKIQVLGAIAIER